MMSPEQHAAWLAERRTGIGGSDIASVLGLSPWKSPYQLWLEKTGREEAEHGAEAAERMHWGTVMEDVVARHYASATGHKLQRINTLMRLPNVPCAISSIDRAIVQSGSRARWDDKAGMLLGAEAVLEVKTAHALAANSEEWGDEGSDVVPVQYWLQCQWYLAVTGMPYADLAVLFGGQRYRQYRIEADTGMGADMLTSASTWWQKHVIEDSPPTPDTEADARRMWRSHLVGKTVAVDAEVADAVATLRDIKEQAKALAEQEQQLRDLITCAFGDAEAIEHGGIQLATWKQNKPRTRTDWQAVADEMRAIDEAALATAIADNTTETDGARVLRLSR